MPNLHAMPQSQQTETEIEDLVRDWAEKRMSPHRFLHTTGVVKAITELATHYAQEQHIPALRLAAWIHDAAKELPDDQLLAEAERLGCPIRPVERTSPTLLHGIVALAQARSELEIDNPITTSAVLYHTTGDPAMNLTDKLFYLADLIEPTRSFSWIMQVRQLVYQDPDIAMLFALTYQLRRMLKRGMIIDSRGLELRNQLLQANVPLVMRDRT